MVKPFLVDVTGVAMIAPRMVVGKEGKSRSVVCAHRSA
jgi:hypothetical protein